MYFLTIFLDNPNVPHYIVNLNGKFACLHTALVYNTDMSSVSLINSQVSDVIDTKDSTESPENSDLTDKQTSSVSILTAPAVSTPHPFFVPRFKSRGRGRVTNVPLDDV